MAWFRLPLSPENSISHYVDTVCVSSYTLKEQGRAEDNKKHRGGIDGGNALIIDDLVDTGKTAQNRKANVARCSFRHGLRKPDGKPYVDTYITEVSQDTWILVPWDSEIQFVEPLIQRMP